MLQSFIGNVQLPAKASISIETSPQTGAVTLAMKCVSGDGKETNYSQVYQTNGALSAQTVMDLLSWLRHTAQVFGGKGT